MAKQKHPAEPAMTLANMRELGVQNLIASCLNDACRHTALIDVSSYAADTEVPSFGRRVVCAKCGGRGNKIDVRAVWPSKWRRVVWIAGWQGLPQKWGHRCSNFKLRHQRVRV
jgi:hypothetical protein